MIYDTLNIPTMASTLKLTICFFYNILMTVIGRVPISKTIWHQKINHIRRVKTFTLSRLSSSLLQLIGFGEFSLSVFFKDNFKLLRLLVLSIQCYKQIVQIGRASCRERWNK